MFMLSENAVQSNYVKQAKNSAEMKSKECPPLVFLSEVGQHLLYSVFNYLRSSYATFYNNKKIW